MTVPAVGNSVFFHDGDNLFADVRIISRRIMEKAELFHLIPRRLERGLKSARLAGENFFVVIRSGLFLVKPASCSADSLIFIEKAVIIQN